MNPKKDDAYIIPLANNPSGAKLVMDDYLLRKPAGSTEWEDDDFLLEMADSYW